MARPRSAKPQRVIEAHVAHALAGDDVQAGRAGGTGPLREGFDQLGADALAAERGRQVDMQVRGILPAQLRKFGAEVADVVEPRLRGRVFEVADRVAGHRLFAGEREKDLIAAAIEVAAEPALAEGVALGARREGATARLEEDGLDLAAHRLGQGGSRRPNDHDFGVGHDGLLLADRRLTFACRRWFFGRYARNACETSRREYCDAAWHAIYHIATHGAVWTSGARR